MAEREFPDGRMQKLKGKPWTSWNLPEQPTELDLRKLRDSFQPPEQYRAQHQSTPLTARSMLLFGTHPDSDFLSITKCPACGWLLKVQHANRHFLRDSRGTIVCKDSDLAIFGSRVLGKACHPLVELKDTYSKKITLRLLPSSYSAPKQPIHSLRGMPLMNEMVSSKSSRSGSSHSSSKTDYLAPSSYRSRSHAQVPAPPPPNPYSSKSRTSSSTPTTTSSSTHRSSMSLNSSSSSSSKGKSGKSHSPSSSSSASWSSLRSNNAPSKTTSSSSSSSSTHKTAQGSYTLSIPSEDMGQNESVEDLLMSNVSHTYGNSKHTVHIIATSNSSKSKTAPAADPNFDHHVKFLTEVPEKRIKLDSSHSRSSSDHYHKSSNTSSYADSHPGSNEPFSKSKSNKYSSSSLVNGAVSSHGSSDSSKSKSKSSFGISSSSSSSSHAKNDLSSPSKHHLRSTGSSTIVTISKPIVSVSSLTSSSSSSQLRSHHLGSIPATISSSSSAEKDKDRDKDRSSSTKKKKRKRDKDEPRKIIPLKDRDFNPDKHCGVCVQGNAVPCKRSLTCKTHSMALRRAVTGRSQSFDQLLAAHKLAKTEEKKSQTKEVIEEIAPPKIKKKKPSGSNPTIVRSSPNDLGTLVGAVEATSYVRSKSPDIEVIAVKEKPKPVKPDPITSYYPKKNDLCPLVYPYLPDTQAKFETVWYNPTTMERNTQMTTEEKNKFVFLLKHYKNPYLINCDVVKPLPKSPREKRNVFSNWNPSEKPVGGRPHIVSWTTTLEAKRPVSETGVGDLQFICAVAKK